jgi:hypothetical protein
MSEIVDLQLFDTRPFPESSPVVDPSLGSDGWERDAVAAFFRGKSNLELTPEAFAEFPYDYSSCHHLFSREAFLYFLPGLMQLVLRDRETDQTLLLGDSLVNTLARMGQGELNDRLQPLLDTYSKAQLAVIAKFLRASADLDQYPMAEKNPALQALRLFWGRFLS